MAARGAAEIAADPKGPAGEQVREALRDGYSRLLAPALETELWTELQTKADQEAIGVFAANVRELLLSPPLGQRRILALDPGFRTGAKLVCLDEQGNLKRKAIYLPQPVTLNFKKIKF